MATVAARTRTSAVPHLRPWWRLTRTQRGLLLRGLAVTVYTVVTAFPFYWMVITIFKVNSDLYNPTNNPFWFNAPPTLSNVQYLLEQTRFGTWMLNSLIIGTAVVADRKSTRLNSSHGSI